MRIIAGALKGRRISSPTWPGLRPTSDRLRETLFNILGDRVSGSLLLDACAGTGAVGFEAISRGAHTVTFIDQDPRATELIREHAVRFDIVDRCEILCGPLPGSLEQTRAAAYDLILVDPPYDAPEIGAILSAAGKRLADGGVLVLEGRRRSPPPEVAGLETTRRVESGGSSLTFYRPITAPVRAGQGD